MATVTASDNRRDLVMMNLGESDLRRPGRLAGNQPIANAVPG
jgi:hypothetical protein